MIRNTYTFEQENIKEFRQRVTNVWITDLKKTDIETMDFWIKNREYIQRAREMKNELFSRIEN
ncbi:MAG: hypothetical protein CMB82_11365 [Flammeovirgaceae bacterium]|nr:hypothetical protein [Flammeovirgaceae bacterium]